MKSLRILQILHKLLHEICIACPAQVLVVYAISKINWTIVRETVVIEMDHISKAFLRVLRNTEMLRSLSKTVSKQLLKV